MNTFWIICTLLAILAFAIGEAYAFRHPERQNTLSRWIWMMGEKWPLSIFLMGMFAGGLAVHFFWHWCPDQSVGVGFMSPPGIACTDGKTLTLSRNGDVTDISCK